MNESEYEPCEFGPDIERTGISLGKGSRQILNDTSADLSGTKCQRYVKKMNQERDGTGNRRRVTAVILGTMAAMVTCGVLAIELHTAPAPTYDEVSLAKSRVLQNPAALQALGLCSLELQAEIDIRRAENARALGPNDGLTIGDYERAAELAAKAGASCTPPDKKYAYSELNVYGRTVRIDPLDITRYNLDDACGYLAQDIADPEQVSLPGDLVLQDITEQRFLVASAGKTC